MCFASFLCTRTHCPLLAVGRGWEWSCSSTACLFADKPLVVGRYITVMAVNRRYITPQVGCVGWAPGLREIVIGAPLRSFAHPPARIDYYTGRYTSRRATVCDPYVWHTATRDPAHSHTGTDTTRERRTESSHGGISFACIYARRGAHRIPLAPRALAWTFIGPHTPRTQRRCTRRRTQRPQRP